MKSFIVLLCGLTIISAIFNAAEIPIAESSNSLFVPGDYDAIQEAINNAVDGQKIYVSSGVYREYLVINKSVVIQGENPSNTIIEGNGTKTIIKVTSNNVSISGFWIRNGETAIYLEKTENCKILRNYISGINFNVYAGESSGTGVFLDKSRNSTIKENFFTDIYYTHILLKGSDNNLLRDNFFLADSRWSQPVLLRHSDDNVIEWNKVYGTTKTNEGGIGVIYSVGNVIQFNDIKQNDWCGISLHSSNDTIIRGNNITYHEILFGLYLKRTVNTAVYWNNFVGNFGDVGFDNAENTSWTHLGLGNYWERYNGLDQDYDGIGDSSYNFSGQCDTSPLMGRYCPFRAEWDGQVKVLGIISNSTVSLNSTDIFNGKIVINSKGEMGNYAFCLVQIPERILNNITVNVNNRQPTINKSWERQNFTFVYTLYTHEFGEDLITIIIPEFRIYMLIFSILTLIALAAVKKRFLFCK